MLITKVFERLGIHAFIDKIKVKSLRKYSHAEFLARHMSYALFDNYKTRFPDGILFGMYDKQNKLCLKQAKNIVSENGLYAAIVKPAVINSEHEKAQVQVIFRGTFCRDSVYRDISPREAVNKHFFDGPGRVSFEKKRDEIVEKIISEVGTTADREKNLKVTLEILGHSLGGSDSQRAVEYLAYKLREDKNHPFRGINLYAFNSPNVESDITARFIESVEVVKIPFKLRYFDVHHDIVQEFGTKRLGYCGSKVKRPENLGISIFKVNRNLDERIAALAKNFFKRSRYFFEKSMEVHTFYSLKLHEYENPNKYNTTFVQNIYSNNKNDVGLIYGKDMKKVSIKISHEEMDDHLVTNAARIGRKIKRSTYKVLNAISFGHWKYEYTAPKLHLKKDAQYKYEFREQNS